MTVSHAPHLSHGSRTSHAWSPGYAAPAPPAPGAAPNSAPVGESRPASPTRRLIQAVGLGAVSSAMVGAPISYLLLLTVVAARGPQPNPELALRAFLFALLVIATPLTVMLRLTPRGLRLRWLPVHLVIELTVALAVGALAGFGVG